MSIDRIKTEEVSLGGIMIPKPVSEPLEHLDNFFYVRILNGTFTFGSNYWANNGFNYYLLNSNLMHLTEENCQRHADALNKLHQF